MPIADILQTLRCHKYRYKDIGITVDITSRTYYCNIRTCRKLSNRVLKVIAKLLPERMRMIVIVKLPIIPITIQREVVKGERKWE